MESRMIKAVRLKCEDFSVQTPPVPLCRAFRVAPLLSRSTKVLEAVSSAWLLAWSQRSRQWDEQTDSSGIRGGYLTEGRIDSQIDLKWTVRKSVVATRQMKRRLVNSPKTRAAETLGPSDGSSLILSEGSSSVMLALSSSSLREDISVNPRERKKNFCSSKQPLNVFSVFLSEWILFNEPHWCSTHFLSPVFSGEGSCEVFLFFLWQIPCESCCCFHSHHQGSVWL